jgi:hypothetical protein
MFRPAGEWHLGPHPAISTLPQKSREVSTAGAPSVR